MKCANASILSYLNLRQRDVLLVAKYPEKHIDRLRSHPNDATHGDFAPVDFDQVIRFSLSRSALSPGLKTTRW